MKPLTDLEAHYAAIACDLYADEFAETVDPDEPERAAILHAASAKLTAVSSPSKGAFVTTDTPFEGWAILELMGHRRLAGYVREVEISGQGLLRLDVPGYIHTEPSGEQEERGGATQFYSPGALYCLTPTTEEIARQLAEKARPEPVTRWELPPAAVYVPGGEDDEDDLDQIRPELPY